MTTRYLHDTNVLSETRKAQANLGVIAFLSSADSSRLFVSVLTLGELRKGVAAKRRSDASAAERLEAWVNGIETTFADRLLPVDAAAVSAWGEIAAKRPTPVVDALIAATAISRGLTLVTRNVRDVRDAGATLLNPWSPP